jgi:hypothetical protein
LVQSFALYRQVDYAWGMATAELGLGRAAREVNDMGRAREALASSLARYRQMGNQHGEREALATLGGLAAEKPSSKKQSGC